MRPAGFRASWAHTREAAVTELAGAILASIAAGVVLFIAYTRYGWSPDA